MIKSKIVLLAGALWVVILAASPLALATDIVLTTTGASGSDGAILYKQIGPQPTGSGVIDSFVRSNGNPDTVMEAYNTTANNVFQNGSTNTFNHALALSGVPTVSLSGTQYYEFNLDINQTGSSPLLSVQDIQVFLTSQGNQNTENKSATGQLQLANSSLVYRLDGDGSAGQNDTITLDFSLNSGSGSGDMAMLVPKSLFDAILAVNQTFTSLVLYTKWGGSSPLYANNDGYEEWFICQNAAGAPQACTPGTTNGTTGGTASPQVPEPSSMLLLSAGLIYVTRLRKPRLQN